MSAPYYCSLLPLPTKTFLFASLPLCMSHCFLWLPFAQIHLSLQPHNRERDSAIAAPFPFLVHSRPSVSIVLKMLGYSPQALTNKPFFFWAVGRGCFLLCIFGAPIPMATAVRRMPHLPFHHLVQGIYIYFLAGTCLLARGARKYSRVSQPRGRLFPELVLLFPDIVAGISKTSEMPPVRGCLSGERENFLFALLDVSSLRSSCPGWASSEMMLLLCRACHDRFFDFTSPRLVCEKKAAVSTCRNRCISAPENVSSASEPSRGSRGCIGSTVASQMHRLTDLRIGDGNAQTPPQKFQVDYNTFSLTYAGGTVERGFWGPYSGN